ncbi:hypothetical protein RHMOL_Rhmol05G0162300 [Rhododendron molle]|uniref:Uncharacterized protein n=1 Tax=Rhododendron molle TaxID=49168 RepID=A0ACC0NPQ9_RHOML|nr:hypothetical protein RHMOL_Rhmol05G0162300 [Rhododendron molle]
MEIEIEGLMTVEAAVQGATVEGGNGNRSVQRPKSTAVGGSAIIGGSSRGAKGNDAGGRGSGLSQSPSRDSVRVIVAAVEAAREDRQKAIALAQREERLRDEAERARVNRKERARQRDIYGHGGASTSLASYERLPERVRQLVDEAVFSQFVRILSPVRNDHAILVALA